MPNLLDFFVHLLLILWIYLFIVEAFVCVVVCTCGLSQICVVSLPYINVHAMAVFLPPFGILFRVPSQRTLL